MKTFLPTLLITGVFLSLAGYLGMPAGQIPPVQAHVGPTPRKTMRAFSSDQEMVSYFKEIAEKQLSLHRESKKSSSDQVGALNSAAPMAKAEEKEALRDDESITNVQHAGVDEGGIVKLHGDHLVVLRRGRLFTVAIKNGALRPISTIDAFGPEINPRNTWYDEMLVSDDTIAVIGYSYERGGTEVGLFNIDRSGQLSYRSTYHLRSNDYYSSRNYASRLINGKLIFYTPMYFWPGADDPFQSFPAVRKWHKGATPAEFRRIVSATRVYRPERPIRPSYGSALHTVTVCDLRNGGFDCQASAVVGPPGRVFYVSPESVYVWVNDWVYNSPKTRAESMLYRMPLDGSAPSAIQVAGSPVDQFSFLESQDAHLNVLVLADAMGEAMWGSELAAGDVALMRLPLADFSDGSEAVPGNRFRPLPRLDGDTFQNRFVGDYLLYGTGNGWGSPQNIKRSNLIVVPWAGGTIRELTANHSVDRIEAIGSDAVVVGTNASDLTFTAVRLGDWPGIAGRYTRKDASQGELRSHGFFYKAEGDDRGLLGLPISLPGRAGYRHLFENSAAILFLRNEALHFEEMGELAARPERATNDGCRASCVDWYGNARPLFIKGRLFGLLGYELVEGRVAGDRIQELRRVSFAPRRSEVTRR